MNVQERTTAPARHQGSAALAIEVRDLVKTYPGGVRALDGLGFTVEAGTVFGLLGPNGAGKSTTVKILTTLARADSGAAFVAGLDVRARPEQVRRAIGVVGQRSGADPTATGRENLVLTGRIQGLRGRELSRRADELLDRFALADAADRVVRTYSGGMQRRLDVAMGLVNRPEVLFLDEPTAGLDPEARSAMWDGVARLSGVEGLTILLTTHYLEEADRLASRLAIIDRGRVVAAGTPDELKGELHGDAVHVELREQAEAGRLHATLDRVPAICEIRIDGRQVSARADEGATAVPLVLAALDGAGLAVGAVTVARPSLDDVYLRHAGRRFAEADEPTSPAPASATATREQATREQREQRPPAAQPLHDPPPEAREHVPGRSASSPSHRDQAGPPDRAGFGEHDDRATFGPATGATFGPATGGSR
jgi:ABC-2 type transport system ATP-binding protein